MTDEQDDKELEPLENCYACMGTGYIKGFGMDGKRCPCVDRREDD